MESLIQIYLAKNGTVFALLRLLQLPTLYSAYFFANKIQHISFPSPFPPKKSQMHKFPILSH